MIKKSTKGFEIVLTFAQQGYGVLRSKRKYTKKFPSEEAIQSLMNWIKTKHISVGGGSTKTVARKSHVETRRESQKANKINPIRSFAIAIWLKNKKQGKISTPSTDFLRPYRNISKTKSFQKGITEAMSKDSIAIIKGSSFSKQTILLKS
jgi:hypothetical protein